MYKNPLFSTRDRRPACNSCALKDLCICAGLNARDSALFENLISNLVRIKRGEKLFYAGQKFEGLYAIRIGFLKASIATEEGHEQVIDFPMTGDLLGLEGIANGTYTTDVVALEDVDACFIPYAAILAAIPDHPQLAQHLQKILSREIIHKQGMLLLLGSLRAEERLAAFLMRLSQRFAKRNYSRNDFVLRMTRAEIGSYLGLKLETISRVLSHFTHENIISVTQKRIQILDFDALNQIVLNSRNTDEGN